jgi:peptidase E
MTTYILHGGETSRNNAENELLFKCFTNFVEKDEVKILMCYFAKDKKIWNTRLETDRNKIEAQTNKKVHLSIAKNPEDLMTKMNSYDVLYVAGGDAKPVESCLPLLHSLKEKLNGKVYIGSSMGAFIASSQYVLSFSEHEPLEVHNGLGFLPISTLCHWDIEKRKEEKIQLLKQSVPQNPILILNECKFTMFMN